MRIVRFTIAAAIAAVIVMPKPVQAERYGVAVGGIEALNAPPATTSHAAAYVNGGGFVLFAPTDRLSVAPGLALEYSPDVGSWGVVGSFVADFPISGTSFGVDVVALVLHDQLGGDIAHASLYLGAGVGGSWFVNDHWTLSLAWNHYLGVVNPATTHSMGPTAFVAYAF